MHGLGLAAASAVTGDGQIRAETPCLNNDRLCLSRARPCASCFLCPIQHGMFNPHRHAKGQALSVSAAYIGAERSRNVPRVTEHGSSRGGTGAQSHVMSKFCGNSAELTVRLLSTYYALGAIRALQLKGSGSPRAGRAVFWGRRPTPAEPSVKASSLRCGPDKMHGRKRRARRFWGGRHGLFLGPSAPCLQDRGQEPEWV